MKSFNTAVVLATGLATAGIGYGTQTLIVESPNTTNANVAKCAPHLGEKTIKRSTLPEGCEYFEGSFAYTETETTRYIPTEEGTLQDDLNVSTTKVYDLPDRASFIKNEVKTQADIEAEKKYKRTMALTFGGIGLLTGLGIIGLPSRRKNNKEDKADS